MYEPAFVLQRPGLFIIALLPLMAQWPIIVILFVHGMAPEISQVLPYGPGLLETLQSLTDYLCLHYAAATMTTAFVAGMFQFRARLYQSAPGLSGVLGAYTAFSTARTIGTTTWA